MGYLTLLKNVNRILIINPFGIGDVLFSTPLISNLKHNYPGLFIGYLCNERSKDLLELNPGIDKLFIWEKDYFRRLWSKSKIEAIKEFIRLLRRLKEANFDLAIDLSLNTEYSFFLSLIGVKERIGYDFKKRGRFLSRKIKLDGYSHKHIVEYYLDLLKFLGNDIKLTDKKLVFPLGQSDVKYADDFLKQNQIKNDDLLVGIIPGGGASWGKDAFYKQWPADKFAGVADGLIQDLSAKIIILGDAKDYLVCKTVAEHMENKAILATSSMNLRQFASLIKRCRLVICNDGGPLHLAVSQGVRTISIFGPVDEKVYGPYPPGAEHMVISGNLSCRPCYKKFKLSPCPERTCLVSITPQEILEAVKKIHLR